MMLEAYLSSDIQSDPTTERRNKKNIYRRSKWKLYQIFLIISWISNPHFNTEKDIDAMNLERPYLTQAQLS